MRINPVSPDEAVGNARKAIASPVGHMALFRLLAHAEGNVLPVMKLGGAILTEQKLSARDREIVVLGALALDGGRYEWKHHVEIGLQVGLADSEIQAIERLDFESDALGRQEQDLLAFTCAVVRDVRIDDAVFAAARNWLDDRETVEAILAIGFYMMLARLTEACELDLDPAQGSAVVDSLERKLKTGE